MTSVTVLLGMTFEACSNTFFGNVWMNTLPAQFVLPTGFAMALGTGSLLLVALQTGRSVLFS